MRNHHARMTTTHPRRDDPAPMRTSRRCEIRVRGLLGPTFLQAFPTLRSWGCGRDTLLTAYNLSIDLASVGRVREACVLGEETLERRRRVLGEDHPDTRRTAVWVEGLVKGQGEPGAGE